MAWDVQPESSKPPADWVPVPGTTKGRDKVLQSSHLTMNVKVSPHVSLRLREAYIRSAGGLMGEDEGIKSG